MRTNPIRDLRECSQFLQTIQTRTPRFVHAGVLLLAALIAAAVTWASIAKVNLVVAAGGRIRPVSPPQKVFVSRTNGLAGNVAEVYYTQGQFVREGDLLIRLDTEKLRNEIARKRRAIQGMEEEIEKGARLADLQVRQFAAALAKFDAEINSALEEVKNNKVRQEAEQKQVEGELRDAIREEESLDRLLTTNAVALSEVQKAAARRREVQERLQKAKLPVEEGRVAVLRKARDLAAEDNSIRSQEVEIKQSFKKAEVEAARLDVANLEVDVKQAELRAPLSGVVTSGDIKVGEAIDPSRPVVEIAEQRGFRIELAVASEDVEKVKLGMHVKIKLEAFDFQKYGTLDGTLEFISPDSTVIEGRAGAVYMARVQVTGDTVGRGDWEGKLKLGMVAQVEMVTGEETVLEVLFKKIRHSVRLQ